MTFEMERRPDPNAKPPAAKEEATRRPERDALRALDANAGQQALRPDNRGDQTNRLVVRRDASEAVRQLAPGVDAPGPVTLPVRIMGTERLQGNPDAERLLTMVFLRVMDLFRAFGIRFSLILGGTPRDGDVLIDSGEVSGPLPILSQDLMPPAILDMLKPPASENTRQPPPQTPTQNVPPAQTQPPTQTLPPPTRTPPTQTVPPTTPPPTQTTPPPTRTPPTQTVPPPTTQPPTQTTPPPTRTPPTTTTPPTRTPPTKPPPQPPVAAGRTARVWGDPHFVGADGGKFDVQGEGGKTYNLLSDSGLSFFGTFDAWGNGITVVGRTGLKVSGAGGTSNLFVDAIGDKVEVNGKAVQDGQSVVMADGGKTTRQGKDVVTTTAEGYKVVQHDQGRNIDAEVSSGQKGVANGQMPTGLMGCTFRADDKKKDGKTGAGAQGEGAIDGHVTDYEIAGGVFGGLAHPKVKGDVDGDGQVTMADARRVLDFVLGRGNLTQLQRTRADVDGDGRVTMFDAMAVLRMAQGGRVKPRGNGSPLKIPKDGQLVITVLSADEGTPARLMATSPRMELLFGGGNATDGSVDSVPAHKNDSLDLEASTLAYGTLDRFDMRTNGEAFHVDKLGEGHWVVSWAGPHADGFTGLVVDVALKDAAPPAKAPVAPEARPKKQPAKKKPASRGPHADK